MTQKIQIPDDRHSLIGFLRYKQLFKEEQKKVAQLTAQLYTEIAKSTVLSLDREIEELDRMQMQECLVVILTEEADWSQHHSVVVLEEDGQFIVQIDEPTE